MQIELIEEKDGLITSRPKNILIKARDPELFPDEVQLFFREKDKIQYNRIDIGIEKVTIYFKDRKAVYDKELFDYLRGLGRIDCYLSSVPLPGENGELYPLFAKYKYGWCCLAPLEA